MITDDPSRWVVIDEDPPSLRGSLVEDPLADDMVSLEKPGGIIALLDEACMFPRSTHETFAEKLYQTFKDNKRFSKPKLSRTDFTICHYAGDVTYQTEFFLDKNKDFVVPEHEALLAASKCSFVSGLFPPSPEETSKTAKFSSIATKFKQQLQALLETLNATEPQYVRCIKPNNLLKPGIFNKSTVLQQLQCGGVMEAIRISCAGFPTRKTFSEFIRRFGVLSPEVLKGCPDEVAGCKNLLEKVNLKGYQIGKTKVFLRAGQMAELDAFRAEVLGRSAAIIQRRVRTYYCRKNFILLRLSAIQIQTICRGQLARRRYEHLRREDASVKIQKNCRMSLARNAYRSLYTSALCIQTCMRRMAAQNELDFRKQNAAAVIIQSHCRRFIARIRYLRLKKAAITAQCWWRRKIASRELRKLKMAAKEAGALKEAKIKLEQEVEELTFNLEFEKKMRADIEKAKTEEISKLQAALQEVQLQFEETNEAKTQENTKLQAALQEMQLQFEETKEAMTQENTKLQADLQEMQLQYEETKEAKAQEITKLQDALQEMQLQFEETKEAMTQENTKLQAALQEMQLQFEETKEAMMQENTKLQAGLQEMQLQFEETKEAMTQENTKLQADLQEMQLQYEETKEAKAQEITKLQDTLQEMHLQFEETMETKTLEITKLQDALQEMQLQFEETKETKTLEITKLQDALQEMQLQFEETKEAKTQETAKLQAALQEMQLQIEETKEAKMQEITKLQAALQEKQLEFEETKALLSQESEAVKEASDQSPIMQEVPVSDNELINKLRAEIESLKTSEAARKAAEQSPIMQEVPVTDNESMNKLTSENENLKVQESAEKAAEQSPIMQEVPVTDNELINIHTSENENLRVQESAIKAAEQSPVMQEVPVTDNELTNKLTSENENLKVEESVEKAAEQSPIMQEVPVIDIDLIHKLTAENENLKALVNSLEKKIDETERKYEECNKLSEERLKQATDAELKIIQLKTSMQRVQEKLSDIETEDQILRQQALKSASKRMSGRFSFKSLASENGDHEPESPAKKFGTEADANLRKSMIERQQESVDILLKFLAEDLGFSDGKPVAAFTIYKCLLHWKSFEAEKTGVFDRLIQLIGSAIEDQEDNDRMSYWLSNSSGLLYILQRSLRTAARKPPTPAGFFGRMTQSLRSSSISLSSNALTVIRMVDAKYPALLFKQQLTAYVEKIYGIIRDNLKKDLSPLLSSCIQAPKTSGETGSSEQSDSNSPPASSWHNVIDCLNRFFNTLKENYVSPVLMQKLFTQVFTYINVQLLNSLLQSPERCTFSNGEYIKSGLAEMEKWCDEASYDFVAASWDELKHIRQAVNFTVINQKSEVSYNDLTHNLCPILGVQQLHRLCTMFSDDSDNTKNISPEVISSMKLLMTDDDANNEENSFLLDDLSSVPFAMDEIINSLHDKTFRDAKPPAELLEYPAFEFLQ
ncbi:hypothetical protein L6164_013044 [Bauhinia variegata]|uniref:Uncharacterized protein n=1 Tax=Bauhinia variegata TaxID=167791 RepID=A0ACB9PEP2_BAUVA|nr:hypothetical protein L6164_013044 [Bauhinia variegata]